MKRYVPELARYSRKYIYEPWTAPIADQKSWGCRITGDGNVEAEMNDTAKAGGAEETSKAAATTSLQKLKTYPKPMFDFPERREICIESIKKAYKFKLHGADPDVLNGTWMKLFDDSPGRDFSGGTGEQKKEEEGAKDAGEKGRKSGAEEHEEDKEDEVLTRENMPRNGSGHEGVDEDEREAAETGEGGQIDEMMKNSDDEGERRGRDRRKRRKVK